MLSVNKSYQTKLVVTRSGILYSFIMVIDFYVFLYFSEKKVRRRLKINQPISMTYTCGTIYVAEILIEMKEQAFFCKYQYTQK